MKIMLANFLLIILGLNAWSTPCQQHPLFSAMPNHEISYCDEKEFGELEVRFTQNDGSFSYTNKQGYLLETWYNYTEDWNKRPTALQLFENYIQAVKPQNGKILSRSSGRLFLQIESPSSTWWVEVSTDNSGSYVLKALREENMQQQITLSIESIEKDLTTSGKAVFYGILFESNKADLISESFHTLQTIADYLNSNKSVRVYVVGHTDNTGSYEHNINLSQRRAETVVKYLQEKHSVNSQQLQAVGIGPISPVATNSTPEGRALNRRVELIIK